MSINRIRLPGYHPAQNEIMHNLNRFNVLDCGRRFGKDIIARDYACHGLIEGDAVGWYEPEYKSLIENWDWFCDTLHPLRKDKSEQEKRLGLHTGGSVEMWSLQDKDASRGRHYKRVIINEAAKVPHLEYSWNAVIRVTLADLMGGAMFGSTPRGLNYFKNLYDRGNDKLEPEWTSFQFSTYDNPYIPRSEIDELKRSMPELLFSQEIMAQFISLEGAVFRRINEAATSTPITDPQEGRQYVAGVDVASSVDFTVICIFDVEAKAMVFMDRFNRVGFDTLEDRLHAVYNRFKMESMAIETNSIGQGVIDHLYNRGMEIYPFTTTNSTKDAIIKDLQAAFEHSEIQIINDPVLIGELMSFESKRNASGSFSYSAPEGLHDDCVMALAIGWNAISNNTMSLGII